MIAILDDHCPTGQDCNVRQVGVISRQARLEILPHRGHRGGVLMREKRLTREIDRADWTLLTHLRRRYLVLRRDVVKKILDAYLRDVELITILEICNLLKTGVGVPRRRRHHIEAAVVVGRHLQLFGVVDDLLQLVDGLIRREKRYLILDAGLLLLSEVVPLFRRQVINGFLNANRRRLMLK